LERTFLNLFEIERGRLNASNWINDERGSVYFRVFLLGTLYYLKNEEWNDCI